MTTKLRPVGEVTRDIHCVPFTKSKTNRVLRLDRDTAYTLLREGIEGKRTVFVPADMIWVGDDDYLNGEYKLFPAKDATKAMYCLTCERFLHEEGCSCGTVLLDDILTLLDHTYGKTDALTK